LRKEKLAAQAENAPKVVKNCRRCRKKTTFFSSGIFRINAQKKKLDVWLIYKCSVCNTTWNLTVFTRAVPNSIPYELLHGFYENDPALAELYANDAKLIKQNGATLI